MDNSCQVIYNTTYQVLHVSHKAWLQWMQEVNIPEILRSGCFLKHQLVRLLDMDESDGVLYAVQFYAACLDDYKKFINLYVYSFAKSENEKWGDAIFRFSSLMQVVG